MLKNSQSAFIGLFFLAIIQPFDFPHANHILGMVFCLGLILACYLQWQKRGLQSIKHYRTELTLIGVFLFANLISVLTNLNHYPLELHLIVFALASQVVWCSTFLCLWLFLQLEAQTTPYSNFIARVWNKYGGWSVLLLLALVALWQIMDYSSANQITQYFVSKDAIANHSGNITSLTRWHTVYGSIAACALISLIWMALNEQLKPKSFFLWLMLICLIGLLFYTGLLSRSRNFIWILGFGLLGIFFVYFKSKWKILLSFIIAIIVLTHILLLQNESLRQRYQNALPYIDKIAHSQIPNASDFIPKINQHSLTARNQLWREGIELWQAQKWLGIGSGAFRALHYQDIEQRNLHNYFLQVLVETGIIGFSLLTLLLLRLFYLAALNNNRMILLTIFSALIFDNFLDYSFAFSVFCAWLILQTRSTKIV